MNLSDKLIFASLMGNTNPPFTQTDFVAGRNLTAPLSLTPSLTLPPFVTLSRTPGQYLTHPNDDVFQLISSRTMMIRFRLKSFGPGSAPTTIVSKFWRLETSNAGTRLFFSNSLFVFDGDTEIDLNTWYTLVWGITPSQIFLRVNKNPIVGLTTVLPFTGKFSNAITFGLNPIIGSDSQLYGDIGAFYIWNRSLTPDEMDALVDGADFPFAPPKDDCKAVSCCEEPLDEYNASNPTPSGASNSADLCNPVPVLTIDPPSGTVTTFPTLVFLHCNRADATIYYTTDGTTPTTASAIYAGAPITISNPNQIVTAFAQVAGCLPGPTLIAQYFRITTGVFKFGYSCDTTDKVGKWGQFTPNGQSDYHWTLQVKFPATGTVKRIELYQTNSVGVWNSGQAWSTDEFINPVEGPANFHVFPLGVFDDGLDPNVAFAFTNQLNSGYLASFKAVLAQQYLWTLIGQPNAPLNGYFKLIVFMADGTRMQSIIGITCGDPPPPCPPPDPPTLTPTCTGIDVTFTDTPGKTFWIYRANLCGDGIYRVLTTGVIASNPQTYHDTTDFTDGCQYCYYLAVDNGACGIQNSAHVCGQKLCLPQAAFSVTPGPGCYPVSVTLAWSTSCVNDGVTQTRIVQESECAGQVITNVTGNDDGTMTVTVHCDTVFTFHYGNSCLADQTKTGAVAISPAFCDNVGLPSQLAIQGYNTNTFFDISPCESLSPCNNVSSLPSWNGVLTKIGSCEYSGGIGQGIGLINIGGNNYKFSICSCQVVFDGSVWRFSINFCTCSGGLPSGSDVLWQGTKSCGHDDPTGVYTRVSGCSTLGSIVLG